MFEQAGFNKRESRQLADILFDEIWKALEGGAAVKLTSFGNLPVRDKQQRPDRNPRSVVVIPIAARSVATFHVSRQLKDKLDQAQFRNTHSAFSGKSEGSKPCPLRTNSDC